MRVRHSLKCRVRMRIVPFHERSVRICAIVTHRRTKSVVNIVLFSAGWLTRGTGVGHMKALRVVSAVVLFAGLSGIVGERAAVAAPCSKTSTNLINTLGFANPASWSPAGVPGAADDVCVEHATTTVYVNVPEVHSIVFGTQPGAVITIAAVDPGHVVHQIFVGTQGRLYSAGITSDFVLNFGTMTASDDIEIVNNYGTFFAEASTTTGIGTLNNHGTLVLDAPATQTATQAVLNVEDFVQVPGATTRQTAYGPRHVLAHVSGSATIEGTVAWGFKSGNSYPVGTTYETITIDGSLTFGAAANSPPISKANGRYARPTVSAQAIGWVIDQTKATAAPKTVARGTSTVLTGTKWPLDQTVVIEVKLHGQTFVPLATVNSGTGSWTYSYAVPLGAPVGTATFRLATQPNGAQMNTGFKVT